MYILDTDHLSILERGGSASQRLLQRLANVDPTQLGASIISYEEQMRGWLSYIAKAQTVDRQVEAYRQLKHQLENYCTIPIIEFDRQAVQEFQHLKKLYPRLGTMDLKIAAITLVNQAVLLTRNTTDFGQISNLSIENWA
jgi:tRNA(fMet)-specific endonuclease VapC